MASRLARVVVTSEADRQALIDLSQSSLSPQRWSRERIEAHVTVVPNGVDLEYFSPRPNPADTADIVFSGKMSYHANVTAAAGLARNIMPRIWTVHPGVRLWIVGKDPTELVRGLVNEDPGVSAQRPSRILVTGTVDDIRPYLRQATIAVAPLRYAVGIQNKVLEAMACGAPVVASQAACAALTARPGRELLVGKNDDEIVAAVLTLLRDHSLRRRIAEAGRHFVERTHDWNAITGSLVDIYQQACAA
jgi:glycosyltransferase involved in cell wall biosynthesis